MMTAPVRAVFVVNWVVERIELGGGTGGPLAGRLRRLRDRIHKDIIHNKLTYAHIIGDSVLHGDGGPASAETRWQVPGRTQPPSSKWHLAAKANGPVANRFAVLGCDHDDNGHGSRKRSHCTLHGDYAPVKHELKGLLLCQGSSSSHLQSA